MTHGGTHRRHALAWAAGSVLAASSIGTWAQGTRPSVDGSSELDVWLEAQRLGWRVPALAVAMILDGRVVYLKGFGHRDTALSLPVNTDTLFRGGSTTKGFASAAVAMLVDEGRMAWDAPVTTYIPELRFSGGDEYRSISLRDMLSHRTGLPRHELLWYNNQRLSRQGLVARMPYLDMTAPPRTRYQYCNLMYVLAGLAIERVTGQTWEAFTQARLLAPLRMQRANLSAVEMAQDANHTVGHAVRGSSAPMPVPLRNDPLLGPAGAVNASIADFARWAQLQLGYGQFEGRRLISAASLAAMWEPLVQGSGAAPQADYRGSHVGLGWRIDRYRDTLRVAHGGDLNGFTSRVVLLPQKNIGLVVLVNHGSHPLPNAVTPDLLDRLLGLKPEDNSPRLMARRQAVAAAAAAAASAAGSGPSTDAENNATAAAAAAAASRPPRALGAYAGRFVHPGYGDMAVSLDAEGLSLRYNDMPATLRHRQADQFETRTDRLEHGEFNGLKLAFRADEQGRVTGLAAAMQTGLAPAMFTRTG